MKGLKFKINVIWLGKLFQNFTSETWKQKSSAARFGTIILILLAVAEYVTLYVFTFKISKLK